MWLGRSDFVAASMGLDADGQWWTASGFGWMKSGPPGSGSAALAKANDVATNVVAPLVGAALTAIVPGVGGIATAAIITAWRGLANGEIGRASCRERV